MVASSRGLISILTQEKNCSHENSTILSAQYNLCFAISNRKMSDNESDASGEDGGLFGSIGFMFDTAREKISKEFNISVGTDTDGEMDVRISLYIIDDDPGHVQSGQYLWPAALSLSSYLMQHWSEISTSPPVQHKSPVIVELGSGVGMCGIFLAKYFELLSSKKSEESNSIEMPSTILLTDYDPGCLDMLSDNIVLNSLEDSCHVCRVEWGKNLTSVFEFTQLSISSQQTPLLVIGSDLLYCVSVVKPLFTSVKAMLSGVAVARNAPECLDKCQDDNTRSVSMGRGLFILASSFDIGEEVQLEVTKCCSELGILMQEIRGLDLSASATSVSTYRIQYFSLMS